MDTIIFGRIITKILTSEELNTEQKRHFIKRFLDGLDNRMSIDDKIALINGVPKEFLDIMMSFQLG